MCKALHYYVIFGSLYCCWGACTYPTDLIGEWYSTSFGTLNFISNQSFTGFTSDLSATPLTFSCFESTGNQYVSMTSYNLLSNIVVDVYLCMNLQQISTFKYYFTLDGNLDSGSGVRIYSPATSGDSVSLSQACSRSDSRTAGEYELLIKKDELMSEVISCPDALQSTFNVTMTTRSVTGCEGSQMEGSTGALVFNYSSCITGQLNSGGYLQCLYSKTDGYTYVTLYNNDTSTDESSTFLFSCLTFEKDAENLRMTEHPNSCHISQTPTTVNSTGVKYAMIDLLYTPPDEKDYTTIIIVICVVVGLIIIVVIIVIILYIKVWNKPTPVPPPKERKRKIQLSITEYTSRSLGRASSVEKLHVDKINKKSTEEIISGLDERKKDKIITVNGHTNVSSKKEAWQKKWESELNKPQLRLTEETLKQIRQSFPSDSGISRFDGLSELDKAYTLSTSLPESIDIPFKDSPRIINKQDRRVELPQSSITPNYTEKCHAAPSIPASTGKFGGSPRMRSTESLPIHGNYSKLDTIKENLLSKENTILSQTGSQIKGELIQNRTLNGGDVTALSSVLTPHSTASVGDIRFNRSLKNISSRNSFLSASSTSIFDDPAWLMENKNAPKENDAFSVFKNRFASIPRDKKREMDPKWFTNTSNIPESSREDMDYFKNRNKFYVGLNGVGKRYSNSLDIIEREKKKRKQKTIVKDKPQLVRPSSPHFEE